MQFSQRMARIELQKAPDSVAAELISLRDEIEIIQCARNLEVNEFADWLKGHFAGSVSEKALEILHGLIYTEFKSLSKSLTSTKDVCWAIDAALEERAEKERLAGV